MNLRPLGYEPNELPDCSTPHNHPSVVLPNRQIEARCNWSSLQPAEDRPTYLALDVRPASRPRIWFITSAARNGLRSTGNSCSSQIASSSGGSIDPVIMMICRFGTICFNCCASSTPFPRWLESPPFNPDDQHQSGAWRMDAGADDRGYERRAVPQYQSQLVDR